MGLLDRFEQSLERLLEGTTGALFRQKLQPAEIGKKLERAMLDNQKASVGSRIVPNAYTVRLNPKDFAQIEDFQAGLSRQMEAWLFQVASRRELTVLDKIAVMFVEDPSASQRNPRIDASITDHISAERPPRRQSRPQRPAPMASPAQATSVFQVASPSASTLHLVTTSGKTFDIPEGTSTIGRSPDNTIVLDSPDVSRRHARLERSGSHLRIYDLNSTNGTRVNGEAIHISDIQDGDELQVGSQILGVTSPSPWDQERRRS
jgi:Protein of unknown function (DUF3662)/FHA domain